MSKDQKEICLYCKWYKAGKFSGSELNRGDCRLRAPIPNTENGQAMWPYVGQWDFCGDFTNRPDNHESTFEHISEPANRVISKLTGGEDAA